ncbi:hypothetical protein AALA82_20780, partial [Oscillospiraceae bacterium 50-16]
RGGGLPVRAVAYEEGAEIESVYGKPVLTPSQHDAARSRKEGESTVPDEEAGKISRLLLARNREAYKALAAECGEGSASLSFKN